MLDKIEALDSVYKRFEIKVKRIRLEKVGHKYYIKAFLQDGSKKTIGTYKTYEEAKSIFEQIRNITNSNIVK